MTTNYAITYLKYFSLLLSTGVICLVILSEIEISEQNEILKPLNMKGRCGFHFGYYKTTGHLSFRNGVYSPDMIRSRYKISLRALHIQVHSPCVTSARFHPEVQVNFELKEGDGI